MLTTLAVANYRSIIRATEHCQVWVESHARQLVAALEQDATCHSIVLEKELGQTRVAGQGMRDEPAWYWPD